MADVYKSTDSLLRDYGKLSQEYKNKAGKYIKNLLRLQRSENEVRIKLHPHKLPSPEVENIFCSFCGKPADDCAKVIAGPDDAFICDECARLCNEILDEEFAEGGQNENV